MKDHIQEYLLADPKDGGHYLLRISESDLGKEVYLEHWEYDQAWSEEFRGTAAASLLDHGDGVSLIVGGEGQVVNLDYTEFAALRRVIKEYARDGGYKLDRVVRAKFEETK